MIQRRFSWTIVTVMFAAAGCGHSSGHQLPVPDPAVLSRSPAVATVAKANTDFTFRLLKRLTSQEPGKNVFISPYSITNALSVLMNGAAGKTQSEIQTTLGLGSTPIATVNDGNKLLLPSLCSPDPKVKVSVANALWGAKPYPRTFSDTAANYYAADAKVVNFGDRDGAAKTINDWVNDNTAGKIDQIVSPDDLSGVTSVITNAVYFHGEWTTPFDKSATQLAPFHRENAADTELPFMQSPEDHPMLVYSETKTFQALALPYGSGRMSFVILLPKAGVKLADVVRGLDGKTWKKTIDGMSKSSVDYYIPRFHVGYQAELVRTLQKMGMKQAVDGPADFRPMGSPGPVSAVLHKTVLDVDETGTTAAASTAVLQTISAMIYMSTVRVDHPFFCAIRDNLTGTILFAGAIYDPQAIN